MKNPIRTLAIVAAVASIVLTGAAFWLSYEHLHDVAHVNGLSDQVRAWAWPATVDLFIIIGEVLMLRAALAGRIDKGAIFLTVAGSGGSIALNVAGVGPNASGMSYVVAAVPPVAALLAFGAIMRQLHGVFAARVALPATRPVAAKRPAATPPKPATAPSPVDATPEPATEPAATEQPAPQQQPVEAPVYGPGSPQDVVRVLWLRLGHRPKESKVVEAFTAAGLPNSRAQAGKIARQVERENTHLPGPRAA